MAVTQTCSVPAAAVELNAGARQQLRHTITCDPDVLFTLKDHQGRILLPVPNLLPHVRAWPRYPDEVPTADDVTHPLGMVFGASGKLDWLIELLDKDGTVIRTVKRCVYTDDANPVEFFDAIRIVIVERA